MANVITHTLALRLGNQRAELGAAFARVADREALGGCSGNMHGFVVTRFRNQQTGMRRAGLAGIEIAIIDAAAHGFRKIGVVEDDACRFAAKLKGDALDRLRRKLADAPACARRAGERHHIDIRVRGQRFADDRAESGH